MKLAPVVFYYLFQCCNQFNLVTLLPFSDNDEDHNCINMVLQLLTSCIDLQDILLNNPALIHKQHMDLMPKMQKENTKQGMLWQLNMN